jgi:hypothetical protein
LVEAARLPLHFVGAATVGGEYAFVSMHDAGLAIVDLRDPTSPKVRSTTQFALGQDLPPGTFVQPSTIGRVAPDVRNPQRIFIPAMGWSTDGALLVADVSDPAKPREIGFLRLSMPPSMRNSGKPTPRPPYDDMYLVQPGAMAQHGNTLYLATSLGIYGVDVTDPTSPRLVSDEFLWEGLATSMDLEDDTLAIVGANGEENGLWIKDVGSDGTLSDRNFVSLAENVRMIEVQAVALHGDRAAVAVGERGVAVIHGIGSPAALSPVWYPVPRLSVAVDWTDEGKLVVSQTHHSSDTNDPHPILTDRGRGIRIIDTDVTPDAAATAWTVAFLPLAEGVSGADVDGRFLFVSNSHAGLAVLDMGGGRGLPATPASAASETPAPATATQPTQAHFDPYPAAQIEQAETTAIRRVGSLDVDGYLYQVLVDGSLALGAGAPKGLYVMDVSNPAAPSLLGTWSDGGSSDNVAWRPPYAFVVTSQPSPKKGRLVILDLSDPRHPTQLSEVELPLPQPPMPIPPATAAPTPTPELGIEPQNRPFGIALVGDTALVAADFGLYAVDVSDLSSPKLVSPVGPTSDMFRRITVVGDRAFVTRPYYDRGGLSIFDVSHPLEPLALGSLQLSGTEELDVRGDRAYLISNDPSAVNLNIVDVSDPAGPIPVGQLAFDSGCTSIVAMDGHAFVTQTYDLEDGRRARGLHIVDTSDASHPAKEDFFQVQNRLHDVAVQGDFAYLANAEDGLVVLDVSKYTSGQPQATESPLATETPASSTTPTTIPSDPGGAPPLYLPILIGGVGLIAATLLVFRRSRSRRVNRSSTPPEQP